MHASFFIPGPLPGMNEIIAARGRWGKGKGKRWNGYSAMKREWEAVVRYQANAARIPAFAHPVRFSFVWRELHTRRDLDNIRAATKLILDALVECGVLPDDGRKWVTGFTDAVLVDKDRPGVDVTITTEDVTI